MISDDSQSPLELLSSDDLGDVGEAEFAALAAKGPLIVNKAIRDRGGWDYMLQASAENEGNVPLDARTVLWTTYVQVKAIWNDRRPSVRLSLSAAEKLVKQKDATFVAALLYDRNTRDCTAIYLVELAGDRLAEILKALRRHQSDGVKALNDSVIYLPLTASDRLKTLSGPAIRERLAEAHRRTGPEGYPTFKTRELATLGKGNRPLRATITLHDIDAQGLFDVLLGKRPWTASLSDVVENRFDIDLPASDLPEGRGQVRFTPAPQARCELTVSWKGARDRLVFNGEHHRLTLPGPKGLITRSRMTFGGFAIEHEGGRISLQTAASGVEAPVLSLSAWRRFWRFMEALRARRVDFSLRSPLLREPLTWSFDAAPAEIPVHVSHTLLAVEAAIALADQLDLPMEPTAMEPISGAAKALVMARHLGMPGKPNFTFTINSVHSAEPDHDRSPQEGVYVDFFDLGETRVAFATRLRMICRVQDGEDVWSSDKARRLEIRRIEQSEAAFAAFAEEAKRLNGSNTLFLGDIDDDFLRRALGEVTEF